MEQKICSVHLYGLFDRDNFEQIGRFVLLFAVELAYIVYMITAGVPSIANMITLGTVEQGETFNEALGIYEYSVGDNSMLFLLYGVVTIMITLGVLCFMMASVRCAYQAQITAEKGRPQPTLRQDIKTLTDRNIHKLLLTWPVLGILIFTITPLVFMILIAFTNYNHAHSL